MARKLFNAHKPDNKLITNNFNVFLKLRENDANIFLLITENTEDTEN